MEHGGGERFKVHSRTYEIASSAGSRTAPGSGGEAMSPWTKLEIWPPQSNHVAGRTAATARHCDLERRPPRGRDRRLPSFDTLNDAVAAVTPRRARHGQGSRRNAHHDPLRRPGRGGAGDAAVCHGPDLLTRLGSRVAISSTRSWSSKWRDLGLSPSPLCSDEEFLRRIYLDAIGTLPAAGRRSRTSSPTRIRRSAPRRSTRCCERPEFVDFWAFKWGDLLRINRDRPARQRHVELPQLGARPACAITSRSTNWSAISCTAEGSTFTEGPANFYLHRPQRRADWLSGSPRRATRLFARNIANRFWGYLMGIGLVEPIDDMRATNPPSNPELLDALADHLVRKKVRPAAAHAGDHGRRASISSAPRPPRGNAGDRLDSIRTTP